jgi:hypothetical protein
MGMGSKPVNSISENAFVTKYMHLQDDFGTLRGLSGFAPALFSKS